MPKEKNLLAMPSKW